MCPLVPLDIVALSKTCKRPIPARGIAMIHVFIRHKVADYQKWRDAFEDYFAQRRDAGEQSFVIGHRDGDERDLCLLFMWSNAEEARKFLDSDGLRKAMKDAGVTDEPDVYIFEQTESGSTG
jgi:hypothetical protein